MARECGSRITVQHFSNLYQERWEIEPALDELKTHLRGARIVLRSKTPNLVRQEFYGFRMAHFAIRGLMQEAALQADLDPDRWSFLRVVRRKLPLFVATPPLGRERPSIRGSCGRSCRSAWGRAEIGAIHAESNER